MKRVLTLITILTALAMVPFASSRTSIQSQSQSKTTDTLPPGKWMLAGGTTRKRGSKVDLYKVLTEADKGLTTTEVWLENRTNRGVVAVKIGWRLYERSNPEAGLLNGETPKFIGVPLSPGERRVVTYPVVSFVKIYQPLLRNGRLEGNYRIELFVTEVLYDDGTLDGASTWNLRLTVNAKDSETLIAKVSSKAAEPPEEGCPNQECMWSNSEQCERCYTNGGSTCSWKSCTSCLEGRCPGLIE